MVFVLFFIFGIFIGSFLNVVIDRLPRNETILYGRSHCDFCKKPLQPFDLIPLLSFALQRGKCRYCHAYIGWKYPIIEITTGLAFVLSAAVIQSPLLLLVTLLVLSCLIIIFFTDMFSGIIPDSVLVVLTVFALLRAHIMQMIFVNSLLAAVISSLFFLVIFFATRKRGMGFGDVKYVFVMGLLLGFPNIITGLYLAFLTGAGIALILVVARRKSFASHIAFGPFLVGATIVHIFWGTAIWTLFLHILGI